MSFQVLENIDANSSNIDYKYDFSDYLQTGELISSIVAVTSSDPSLTIESSSITDTSTSITVILSGGTLNQWATVTVRFTTDSTPAKTDDATFRIFITNK